MKQLRLEPGIVNYPMPVALVGTAREGKDNYMAAAWLSMVSHTPPRIAVSLGPHLTRDIIRETGVFSLCFPSVQDEAVTDYCGVISGTKADKSALFSTFRGETGAPLVQTCALNAECRLNHIDINGLNETFVGDIVGLYADESVLTDGKVDLAKLRPLLLSQLDARYYALGPAAGRAWKDGVGFRQRR